MVKYIPHDEVFNLKTQLQEISGYFRPVQELPTHPKYPLLGILSAGDVCDEIIEYYTILQYDTQTSTYLSESINLINGEYTGVIKSLSDTEGIYRWKFIGDYTIQGSGIRSDYYNSTDFSGGVYRTRYDVIDFNWEENPSDISDMGISDGVYSIRCAGLLRIPTYGDYKFRLLSVGGVRLWVDNILVVDRWNYHSSEDETPYLSFNSDFVTVRIEFFNNTNNGHLQLMWITPSSPNGFSVVPRGFLYSPNFVLI